MPRLSGKSSRSIDGQGAQTFAGCKYITKKVGYAEGDHRPERSEVHGSKGEGRGNELTDDEDRDSRANAHLRDEFVTDDAADDNPNAADNNRHGEKPPAKVVIGEVLAVKKVAVVGEAHATCKRVHIVHC
jgi:hypothetical protein